MALFRFNDPDFSDPNGSLRNFRREMDRLFSDFFSPETMRRGTGVFPQINIYQDKDKYFVTAELPGVEPKNVDISIHGGNLVLKGERKIKAAGERVTFHRRERTAGSFSRAVALPERVDAGKVIAEYKNGVLTLTLPLAEEAKPRKIEVKSA